VRGLAQGLGLGLPEDNTASKLIQLQLQLQYLAQQAEQPTREPEAPLWVNTACTNQEQLSMRLQYSTVIG